MATQRHCPLPSFHSLFLLLAIISHQLHSLHHNTEIPNFQMDFPATLEFANSTGGRLPCSANGMPIPKISWNFADGTPVRNNAQALRHVTPDGTLVFSPFKAEDYRQDVHAVPYRCTATNILGTVASIPIQIKGIVLQSFDIHVYDVYAMKGNSVVMKCHKPEFLKTFVSVTGWIKDSVMIISPSEIDPDSKYLFLPNGDLYIRNVTSEDGMSSFRCQATQRLTGETKTSTTAARLIVTVPQATIPPKITSIITTSLVQKGKTVFLPCIVQGNPVPSCTWSRQNGKGHTKQIDVDARFVQVSGSLLIRNIRESDSGTYICSATNSIGSDKMAIEVNVAVPLKVSINPTDSTVDLGKSVTFHCSVTGGPINNINWLKNGLAIDSVDNIQLKNDSLIINSMTATEAGIYQCFVTNTLWSVFGTATVRLGDAIPEFVETFEEMTLHPGESARLKCSAAGNPPPELSWSLDHMNIPTSSNAKIQDAFDGDKKISSVLILENVKTESGGVYQCIAKNKAGTSIHQNRINVYGQIMIRKNVKIYATAENIALLDCPYYGYPVNSISWEKDGRQLPLNMYQEPLKNGTLRIRNIQRRKDNGMYTCIITTEDGRTTRGELELTVMVRPKITPFSFQEEQIREGTRARIQCVVSDGESPLKVSWVKDGRPIPQDLGVSIRDVDEFSSILMIGAITPRHNGNYTCVVSNAAGQAQHTALLFVNVPPKLVPFSFQEDQLLEGSLVRVSCVVSRGDLPLTITWLKDGKPIPKQLNVKTRDFDDYSNVLSIDPLESQHSGDYTCMAKNQAGVARYTTTLLVNVPPEWVIEPEDMSAKIGQELLLNCKAKGFPQPTIAWTKKPEDSFLLDTSYTSIVSDDNHQIFSNGSLKFDEIQRNDAGQYYCIASNGVGRSLSKAFSIKINAAPDFKTKNQVLTVRKGDSVQILCKANGDTPISYQWKVNDNMIDSSLTSQRYKVNNHADKSNFSSELSITWVDIKDSANFTCEAKNEFGHTERYFRIIVQEVPEAPVISNVKVIEQNLELQWTVPYNGNSQINKYYIQYKKLIDSWDVSIWLSTNANSTYISNLLPATQYNVRLRAQNMIGNSSFSEEITAKTDETVPNGISQNVQAESIDTTTLRITWKPPPKDTWNGAIRGYNIGFKPKDEPGEYSYEKLDVPEDYTEDLIYQLSNLRMYTQYVIEIQAYNSKGPGPSSKPIIAMTSEGVPSEAPNQIRCSTLSPKSLYVLWVAPDSETTNGILRGYKVLYKPAREWYDALQQSKIVQTSKITLQDLEVNTNYSIEVQAFTKAGDGIKSDPIFCKTHEDVPEPPTEIKVLPASSDSVVISWKPSNKSVGVINQYNVYYKPLENGQEYVQQTEQLTGKDAILQSTQADVQYMEVSGLKKNSKYIFWVTATSALGESPTSPIAAQTVADSAVPAKSASFNSVIKTAWKQDVVMPCIAVGNPVPQKKWTVGNEPLLENDRIIFRPDGAVMITKTTNDDSGNYTCAVYNEHGRDEVKYSVIVQVPPSAPKVSVISKTKSSIQLQWKAGPQTGEPIRGYLLHYKREREDWITKELRPEHGLFNLEELACGTTYQIFMQSFNAIGTGPACETITVATDGAESETPPKEKLIREGSTFATVHIDAWPSSGCPIDHFSVEFKELKLSSKDQWVVVGSKVSPLQKKLLVSGLKPATRYLLRIHVFSSSGTSVLEYRFATLTAAGETISVDVLEEIKPVYIFYMDPIIFIPAMALLVVVLIASIIVCIVAKRKNGSVRAPSDMSVETTQMNTWTRNSGMFPQDYGYSCASSTLSSRRTSKDPTPYATTHMSQYYPEASRNVMMQGVFPRDDCSGTLKKHAAAASYATWKREQKLLHETPFGSAAASTAPIPIPMCRDSRSNDDYDPPPKAHMTGNFNPNQDLNEEENHLVYN